MKQYPPETNIATENGWLEYDRFLLEWPIFRGELLVLGSVASLAGIKGPEHRHLDHFFSDWDDKYSYIPCEDRCE